MENRSEIERTLAILRKLAESCRQMIEKTRRIEARCTRALSAGTARRASK